MPRKGTSYLFKIGFPTPQPEHRNVEAKKPNFKDNLEYRDPSLEPEGLPLPAPPAPELNADGNEVPSNEYYHTGLSAMESCIVSVGQKVDQAVANPHISVSSMKKMARKMGRDQKFLKSVKEDLVYMATNEAALYFPHDGHELEQLVNGLEQAGEPEVEEQGVQVGPAMDHEGAVGPGVEPGLE